MWPFFKSYAILTSALGPTISSELKLDLTSTLITLWQPGCDINILHSTFGCAPVKERGASTASEHHWTTLRLSPKVQGIKSHNWVPRLVSALLSSPSLHTPCPSHYWKTFRCWQSKTLLLRDIFPASLSPRISGHIFPPSWPQHNSEPKVSASSSPSTTKTFSTGVGKLDPGYREPESVHSEGARAFGE